MAYSQPLILASASARRATLLDQIGVAYAIDAADIDETPYPDEPAGDYVMRMARNKAESVASRYDLSVCPVLGADTTVVLDDVVLGKPADAGGALAMLLSLSGRWHTVMTAVCVVTEGQTLEQLVSTQVQFVELNSDLCEAYLQTDEPWDKAGAYGIQCIGGVFVRAIAGSYSNVVGLPIAETWQMLSSLGVGTALEHFDE